MYHLSRDAVGITTTISHKAILRNITQNVYIRLMTFDDLSLQFKSARPLLLLRSKNAPFILSFFYKVFKESHVTTIAHTELKYRLEGFMEELEYEDYDEELAAATLFDDYSTRAAQYLEKWSNAGFLRKYPDDNGEHLHELTADTNKVMKWLEDLGQREFIGTNSRFKDIFFKLKDMVEKTNENVEVRIQKLENKKWEIENEINLLKLGKKPALFDETEIKEQFYELNKMARELLRDFSEVEQNFEVIRKEIQRKYTEKDVVKGSLLVYALDAIDEMESKDQGKSFKAFWEFLMDEKKQHEFTQLTEQIYELLKDRNIDYNNDKFLKHLKRYLHASGKKVIDSNKKLSEKISRVLSEKSRLERKKAMELIGDIRQMAYALADAQVKDDAFFSVENEPFIDLFDRWELGEETETGSVMQYPEGPGEDLSHSVDLRALFDQFTIDRKKLLGRIEAMLEGRTQVTLKEIVDHYGLENGLSEIVGYFSIATSSHHHIIIEEAPEAFWLQNRKVNVPMIIYTKANH